jgi:demethylmenaquinone methyltransferase/2-methoxy-6-polyprenyl-1,4-benzoquinol methylase
MPDENLDYEPNILRVQQSKAETKTYYDKLARVYDLLSERTEEPMRKIGLKMLNVAAGETVLEIGCGTGHCLVKLAKAVGPEGKVHGLDLSENMLAESKKRLESMHLNECVELRCGDAESLSYADGLFDGIFMSFTLELFDTPAIRTVLSECKRVLRPTGRLVAVSLTKEGQTGFVLRAYEWTHCRFPALLDCRPIYVKRAFEAAGFEVKKHTFKTMWIPVEIVMGTIGPQS